MNDILIIEISRISKEKKIEIDYKGNVIFKIIDYQINTIKLNSKESIEILDKLYIKWCNVFRNIAKFHI